jgi:hypothetical protein
MVQRAALATQASGTRAQLRPTAVSLETRSAVTASIFAKLQLSNKGQDSKVSKSQVEDNWQ